MLSFMILNIALTAAPAQASTVQFHQLMGNPVLSMSSEVGEGPAHELTQIVSVASPHVQTLTNDSRRIVFIQLGDSKNLLSIDANSFDGGKWSVIFTGPAAKELAKGLQNYGEPVKYIVCSNDLEAPITCRIVSEPAPSI